MGERGANRVGENGETEMTDFTSFVRILLLVRLPDNRKSIELRRDVGLGGSEGEKMNIFEFRIKCSTRHVISLAHANFTLLTHGTLPDVYSIRGTLIGRVLPFYPAYFLRNRRVK